MLPELSRLGKVFHAERKITFCLALAAKHISWISIGENRRVFQLYGKSRVYSDILEYCRITSTYRTKAPTRKFSNRAFIIKLCELLQWRSQVLGFGEGGGAKIPTWSSGRAEGTSFLGSPGQCSPGKFLISRVSETPFPTFWAKFLKVIWRP